MILNGGTLTFHMGSEPNKNWGQPNEDRPVQKITDHLITPVPYFIAESKTFENNMTVSLEDLDGNAEMRWGFGTEEDEPVLRKFSAPFNLTRSSKMVAVANKNGKNSFFETAEYFMMPEGRKVAIKNPYNDQYTAGGDKALIDLLRGGADFRTGEWQGYYGVDFEATVDLGKIQTISAVGAGFNQNQGAWIWMPTEVSFEISGDGQTWQKIGTVVNDIDPKQGGGIVKDFTIDRINEKGQFVRVFAKNIGKCPSWHVGAGDSAWIFIDEIWVK
jgi:hypothetical protein